MPTLHEIVKQKNIKLTHFQIKEFGIAVAGRFSKINNGRLPNKVDIKLSSGKILKLADYPDNFVPVIEKMLDDLPKTPQL